MNVVQLSVQLSEMMKAGKTLFVYSDPEVIDFSKAVKPMLYVSNIASEIAIPLDPDALTTIAGLLHVSLFEKDTILIGWNLKNVFSHLLFHTKRECPVACQIYDLKLLEAYLGKRDNCPATLANALIRLKAVMKDSNWPKVQEVHKRVHLPLLLRVIPGIETSGLLNEEKRDYVYPHYEIEGQVNGRMKCNEAYQKHYNPHAMSPEEKERLLPKYRDEFFMYFDYHHMEASMIQWLAGDAVLGEMLRRPGDVYANIYHELTGKDDRENGKKLFLGVIYGESAATLAKEWEIPFEQANHLVNRLQQLFATSFHWIEKSFENGAAVDHFGRRRIFDDKLYRTRNFLVQSPAALVCLEKLIDLDKAVRGHSRVLFHVHDGYVVSAKKDNWKDMFKQGIEVLETESTLCPGLKLEVGCRAGRRLNELKNIGRSKGSS